MKIKNYSDNFVRIIKELEPDEVQINTPLRKCPVKPLSKDEIEEITIKFRESGINVISVYEEKKPDTSFIDIGEVLMRRPISNNSAL